ncbi:ulp1 protease family, C-terminal catalytic domain protein [Chlamydia ibidis]|uniref:Ulp1 protease family, C-terminal catalytic domain protein n=1 Tax=Chlamydia ibidis TaxID=1405396 RepID=S7J360_9CHLA|nr:ulp1 protease family, C-terminal catalytic domain protein [Chlamydia ibidis]
MDKISRVLLAIFCILVTLGLILIFLPVRKLLDLDIYADDSIVISNQFASLYQLPHKYIPNQYHITGWDTDDLISFGNFIKKIHPKLSSLSFSKIISIYNAESITHGDLLVEKNKTEHSVTDNISEDSVSQTKNFVLAYPLWHHPLATSPEDMWCKMREHALFQHIGLSHWTLLIVNTELREVVFFDSLANYINNSVLDPMLSDIAKVSGQMYPLENQTQDFTIKKAAATPLQQDGTSCGIWVAWYLDKYLSNPEFSLSNLDANRAQSLLHQFYKNTCSQLATAKLSSSSLSIQRET